jgi:ABC-type dipeptide/oligopeptide/nickel transport system permease component
MFVAGAEQPAVQYGRWISRAAHGDFGRSIMLRRGDLYRRGSVAP